jgi:hypothetical protein
MNEFGLLEDDISHAIKGVVIWQRTRMVVVGQGESGESAGGLHADLRTAESTPKQSQQTEFV